MVDSKGLSHFREQRQLVKDRVKAIKSQMMGIKGEIGMVKRGRMSVHWDLWSDVIENTLEIMAGNQRGQFVVQERHECAC
jgi:hypothetical protein